MQHVIINFNSLIKKTEYYYTYLKDFNIKNLINHDMNILINKDAIDYCTNVNNDYETKTFEDYLDYYQVSVLSNKEYVITILSINSEKVKEYYELNKVLPNQEILINCIYKHLHYIEYIIINQYYDYIVKDYILENVNNYDDKSIETPYFINAELYLFQKRNIFWMLNRESNANKFYKLKKHEYQINDVYIDIYNRTVNNINNKESINKYYGALIDEVGLGKTLQFITLCMLNKKEEVYNKIKLEQVINFINSRATLIICPNHLCGQWKREIESKLKCKVKIISMLTKVHFNKYTYKDIVNADFIIMSFNFLENKVFLESNDIYNYFIQEYYNNIHDRRLLQLDISDKKDIWLSAIKWHRIVIDEIHEVFTQYSSKVINTINYFKSDRKWILSGTPFNNENSMSDIYKYLTGEENIVHNFHSYEYIKNNIFRRNTKKSVEEEFKLPPIKESVIYLKFTQTERMMYNAYLNNNYNNNRDIISRQICCYPKLAEELKVLLEDCSTLEDVENKMFKYYELEYKKSLENLENVITRINKNGEKMTELVEKEKEIKKIKKNKEDNKEYIESKLVINKQQQLDLQDKIKKDHELKTNLEKTSQGKKATYDFYVNVFNKLRKIKEQGSSEEEECSICLTEIAEDNIGVTKCGHIFCYSCLNMCLKNKKQCPNCRTVLQEKNDVFKISYQVKKDKDVNKSKLIDKVGTKLANMIYFLKNNDHHTIIFSQWHNLLNIVGEILNSYNIKNLFCQGNVFQKDKIIREFNDNDNIKVIMLSSNTSVAGANLTKAKQIIILEPIVGSYEYRKSAEWQAIGRAHRMGQKNIINIVRFIIKDTIEEEVYLENLENEKKVQNKLDNKIIEILEEPKDNILEELEEKLDSEVVKDDKKLKKLVKKNKI